jgi:radical SAM superfamily enzyme YgiQ (UPF0313 family)
MGVLYLSSYLKQNGHEAIIIDALRDNLDYKQILERIESIKPDVIGIHCLSSFFSTVCDISNLLKDKKYKVFIGGVHPTFQPYTTLKKSRADYVVCGEGEIPLLKLCNNNYEKNNIQGVYSINDLKDDFEDINGNPIKKAEIVENLDELPFPDWEQCPPDSYPKAPHGVVVNNYPIGLVMTSRGCPFRCTFCSSHNFYKGVRFRSVDNVIKEIKYLIEKFHIKELHFLDDNLTLKKSYVLELCKRIKEENIKIDWTPNNGIRADAFDDEVAVAMKDCGCYMIVFGIEAVNKDMLKRVKKGETIETITEAINCANRNGFVTLGNFIFGLPEDTEETINETIDYAVKSKLDRAGFFALSVLPGSDIANDLHKKGIEVKGDSLFSAPDSLVTKLTPKQIEKLLQKAYWKFYFRPKRLFNMVRHIPISQYKYFFRVLGKFKIFKFW